MACYSPDMSGFNVENTYYVTYDKDGNNEQIAQRIDRMETPKSGWYDYGNKVWANIVTVNGDAVTYWTWIPRYMYNANSDTKKVEMDFVDLEGNTQNGKDLSTLKLSDAFQFSSEKLKGYWVSKYELQDIASAGIEKIQMTSKGSRVTVSTTAPSGRYTIFINGAKVKTNVELPLVITGLKGNEQYDICVYSETSKRMIGNYIQTVPDLHTENIEVDLSGFNPENTYYVTYDSNGNNEAVVGRIDKTKQPSNWYSYADQIWANVVTVNGDAVTYWTYIPRYEYVIEDEYVNVKYIKSDQTTADKGYTIPETFQFSSEKLKGYWVSKYELQDTASSGIEKIKMSSREQKVTVSTTEPSGTYSVFVDGVKRASNVELPYVLTDLEENKQYDICVYSEKHKRIIGNYIQTVPSMHTENIEVDLSGFNPDCTYYVTYDENGNNETTLENCTKIELDANGKPTNMPKNWYDYSKKIWANVVTTNNNLITYWTYIPRYEYVIEDEYINVKYIKSDQTMADKGYTIPDSFKFNSENLKGYWVSKYELQSN